MKQREHDALNKIADPEIRKAVANAMGITPQSGNGKEKVVWQGGQRISQLGN